MTTTPNDTKKPKPIPFTTFLESIPPGAKRTISDLFTSSRRDPIGIPIWTVSSPKIQLHCPTAATCGGDRTFEVYLGGEHHDGDIFLTYVCRNCKRCFKTYALQLIREENQRDATGSAEKYGEMPVFGSPLPPRLISMAGADHELLLNGWRSESQSLGIGSFGYYRRVVEHQKDRILKEVRKAAERLGANEDLLSSLDRAKEETQFSKAINLVKNVLPDGLKVQGQDPLKLLHGVLSKGVHNLSDEECLERAQAVRIILTKLVSNIARVTTDEHEVSAAIKKLRSLD